VGTELFEALRAADSRIPTTLEAFDRIVASGETLPDFYEHSVRLADRSAFYRLTYYFDVHRRGADVAREAGSRFVELSGELGCPLPAALSAFVRADARAADEVLQVVLGIDATADEASTRCKYYLVFRDAPRSCVTELLGALGLTAAAGADPGNVYILGVDVTPAGLDDLKLYFRLESRLVPKLIDNLPDVADLLAGSRDVVFQQCTRRPERRRLYLHARNTALLSEWLASRGFDDTLERARAINARLSGGRIEPWIVAFSYDRRRLDVEAGTVYFHLATAGSAR
jgi:hypothetical protein